MSGICHNMSLIVPYQGKTPGNTGSGHKGCEYFHQPYFGNIWQIIICVAKLC